MGYVDHVIKELGCPLNVIDVWKFDLPALSATRQHTRSTRVCLHCALLSEKAHSFLIGATLSLLAVTVNSAFRRQDSVPRQHKKDTTRPL